MKRLSVHDLKGEDSLQLMFDGVFDPRAVREKELEYFFEVLETHAGDWMPDIVKSVRQRKYGRAAFLKALDERGNDRYTHCGLFRTKWPALDMCVGLHLPPLEPVLDIMLEVKPLSFFAEADRCQEFVDLVRAWAARYPVIHAAAHSVADSALTGSPAFGRDKATWFRDGFDKVYEVSWLNVFSPKLVQAIGRERVLSTPAWRVEELSNGCVLLVTWPTAADFASDEARLAQARAHAHLRPDLDFDSLLLKLRERSAVLAPVQPRFHPDVAPLLSRVVDSVGMHERQRKIAEFNAWQPPEAGEWFPSHQALPVNVSDPERAREQYSALAEQLVALMHAKAPSVFQASPESLTDVDYQFWHQDFPRVFNRDNIDRHAVPAIGAYLGEVLVRNLGGQWIPREDPRESHVLVGTRVWFPFIRAWRYMRSCQSLLDFSLTQLYRVAERHRS